MREQRFNGMIVAHGRETLRKVQDWAARIFLLSFFEDGPLGFSL
jgi:hypothetical protein